jgi:hypothetical protein
MRVGTPGILQQPSIGVVHLPGTRRHIGRHFFSRLANHIG